LVKVAGNGGVEVLADDWESAPGTFAAYFCGIWSDAGCVARTRSALRKKINRRDESARSSGFGLGIRLRAAIQCGRARVFIGPDSNPGLARQ